MSLRVFILNRFLLILILTSFTGVVCSEDGNSTATGTGEAAKEQAAWDIEETPGKTVEQAIDTTEGTWITVDVSPDGKKVVFDLLGDLYEMPIEGADGKDGRGWPSKLTSGVAWDMQPAYSPSGKQVAFTSDRTGADDKAGDNLWILSLDGKEPTQVTKEAYRLINGASWSPDGDYLVGRKHFTSRRSLGAGEMWMYHKDSMRLKSTAGVPLTSRVNDQKDVNEPVFSPDGRYLYYSQDVTPGNDFEYDKDSIKGIYAIKRLDLETGDTEVLLRGPGGACRPTPSPDGKQLAFVRRVGAKTGLHLFDLKSGAVRLVYDLLERDMQEAWAIHGVYPHFAWMPDGEAIVIWAKGKIRKIDVEAGTAEVIPFHIKDQRDIKPAVRFAQEIGGDTFDVKMLRWVTVSPKSDRVAYQALGHIYIRDLPDGTPKRLTNQETEFEFCPNFSRDGKYVVYSTWNDRTLGSVRIASVDPEQNENWIVTPEPGHYVDPVFSPDGQLIVYRKESGGGITSPLWSRESGLYSIPKRDGKGTRISKIGIRPQFGLEQGRVFFQQKNSEKEADNLELRSIDLSGNEERTHYSSTWATDFRISPDSTTIAFIERFHVYIAPFVQSGRTIKVGPSGKGLPIQRVSSEAGDFIHFSGDSKAVHWSLGADLFTSDLSEPEDDPQSLGIGFTAQHARPSGQTAIVNARILTMGPAGVIESGTILIDGNRIVAVGKSAQVAVPENAYRIDVKGQVVGPGFIDTHAHGSQAANGMTPQQNWVDFARLAFGVTTIHDPSNQTHSIFAASELTKAGLISAPRTFSTGTILYGATSATKAEIDSIDDARFHLRRMKAVGAFTVKSYNQPRRDQRQQVLQAARELEMMVVPEGGSTFMHNMTMIVDGHTGIEHTLPVQTAYDDVMDLWRGTGVGYTPTLNVAYGGISGEQYWFQIDDLWLHPRLQTFIPPHVLNPRARRRQKSPDEDYNHMKVAEIARQVVEQGGLVQAGGHGQLNGICTHWEMWSFVQGGMTPMQALVCGTLNGAKYLGLDGDLGSIEVGKLADLVVFKSDADPTVNIRDTERVQYVVANGEIYEADRMNRFGSPEPRRPFYWQNDGAGTTLRMSEMEHGVGCSCLRGRQ
ncbi:MAG: amidohydrolase [Planctomycetaceae bacterium TMED240]|nr:MAG: amidohydrolase [Planctomycetaceae bacterium TMED240]